MTLFCCRIEKRHLPIDLRKACVRASVLDISREKISEPASIVKGVSSPKLFAIPMLKKEENHSSATLDSPEKEELCLEADIVRYLR